MKIIVSCSGGKDSVASLLWMQNNGYKDFDIVFCDTNWESDITYSYLKYLEERLNKKFIFLKSKKYEGMIDLATKKKRFPSTRARFCTIELKTIPMIDYILDEVKDHSLIIQGIRGAESHSRSLMESQCTYFKYYFEPYGYTKKGKPKYHTYRKKEIFEYCQKYQTDVLRPVFEWSGQDVINYSLDNNVDINPLYSMGSNRVGCYPCIMSSLSEINQIANRFPERILEIAKYEEEVGSSFFPVGKIPKGTYKGKFPMITDVAKYAQGKYDAGELFDDHQPTSCMSFYGLCE